MRESLTLLGKAGHLAAHLYLPHGTPPFPAVVLCHGITSCKDNYTDIAEFLQTASLAVGEAASLSPAEARLGAGDAGSPVAGGEGFAVLAYDCRGHGESGGALDGEAWQDVGTALEYLQRQPDVDWGRIALVGSSMGAHNGLRAAAEYPVLRTLAIFNTAPSAVLKQGLLNADYWRWIHMGGGQVRVALPDYLLYLEQNDVFDLPARIAPRPILFIHARDDDFVPYSVSERLYASAPEGSRLWLLDEGGHSGPRHDPGVQRVVADWLREKM